MDYDDRIDRDGNDPLDRVYEAVDVALEYGSIDGANHKQWVIDQMLRKLLGTVYDDYIAAYNSDDFHRNWNTGIAP